MATSSNWTAEAEKALSWEIGSYLYGLPGDIAEFAVYALLYDFIERFCSHLEGFDLMEKFTTQHFIMGSPCAAMR
ncbi:hypothetical protein H0H92_015273, partial [Tricholoma furcatifolium]